MTVLKAIAAGFLMSMASLTPVNSEPERSDSIRVISSMATSRVLSELIRQFEEESGYRIELESVGGVDAARRVEAGEAFDLVILASGAVDKLTTGGRIVPGSRTDLVRSGVAVAIREGAPAIDIGSEEAVKKAVLGARTISYSTGPSGVYLTGLFERWGIDGQIRDRIVQAPPGIPVGSLVAKGEVELGFQQLSELIHLEGIIILGALPDDIQIMTVFSAGVATASKQQKIVKKLVEFLAAPEAAEIKRRNGMEPA